MQERHTPNADDNFMVAGITAWKVSVFAVFWSECWKIRTRKISNTNTFHWVFWGNLLSQMHELLINTRKPCTIFLILLRFFRISGQYVHAPPCQKCRQDSCKHLRRRVLQQWQLKVVQYCCKAPHLEAVDQRCSVKKVFLETLAQVFSCELCEISENTFSYRTHLVAASTHLDVCKNPNYNSPYTNNLAMKFLLFANQQSFRLRLPPNMKFSILLSSNLYNKNISRLSQEKSNALKVKIKANFKSLKCCLITIPEKQRRRGWR